MKNAYLLSLIYGQPLMIERNKLRVILGVLSERTGIEPPLIVAAPVMETQRRQPQPAPQATGIAVIDIMGSLVHRRYGIEADSGLASYEMIGQQVLHAGNDPRIGGVLLHVDSPGGEVAGAYPLASLIRDVGKQKPVWAVVDEAAWSAGYLLASQASRVLLSENGSVGSVGICFVHRDESARDAKEGYAYSFIYRGDRKTDFNPHQPLSEGARASVDKILDREYAMFVDHVARARKMKPDQVRETQASLIYGQEAIDGGFADGFMTLYDAAGEMTAQLQSGTSISMSVTKPRKGEPSVPENPQDAPVDTQATAAPQPALTPAPNGAPVTAPAPALTAADYEEIAAACTLARKPHLTAQFIQERKSVAEVKKILLAQAAQEDEQNETLSAFEPARGALPRQAKPQMSLAERMKLHLAIK